MSNKDLDLLVFGATGFTGKFVAQEIASLNQKDLKWGISDLKKSLKGSDPQILVADVNDQQALESVIKRAKVLINCVGPFRYWGEAVVKACIASKTDYVDINGETEFVERIFYSFNEKAREAGVAIVSTCGFDCIPTEIGNLFVKKEFEKRNAKCSSVEIFVSLKTGPSGCAINYATYEAAVQSISNVSELRALRKKVPQVKLPVIGKRLPVFKNPRYESRVKRWVVPFMGADSAIIKLGQQMLQSNPKNSMPPTQVAVYFSTAGFIYLFGLLWFGLMLGFLTKFKFGIKILLQFPGFFSFGMFTRKGPSANQIKETSFVDTIFAKGVTADNTQLSIKASVTGPEPGYVSTPIAVVACALTMLNERFQVGSGVLTPAAAFFSTKLIERLDKGGIKFTVLSEN